MAKRLVCCPVGNDGEGDSFRYLYVDTAALRVEDVTDILAPLAADLKTSCCLDRMVGYANGDAVLDDQVDAALPFDFRELNSFEVFRSTDELRLKTGSEKIFNNCLLSYYRREYDATQQHTFLSEPGYNDFRQGGVEHELTLENRVVVKKKEEEFIPETLDKGKSDAEKEAEAAAAQAQADLEDELAKEEAKAQKQERIEKRRKLDRRRAEEEAYRDFRNQDNVQSEQYLRMRRYEEEMRLNNEYLADQYAAGNYSSLPGYTPPDVFAAIFESVDNETLRCSCSHKDLYALGSRLDEFGVNYTVLPVQSFDGRTHDTVCCSSYQTEAAQRAIDFFELEKQLYGDKAIAAGSYYNAFQLQAFNYAYQNHIDTSYVDSGSFNSSQMYRIFEAGLNGYDMSILANPNYSSAHMDALVYYMDQKWDTGSIKDPGMSMSRIADNIFREEQAKGVAEANKFFTRYDYDAFIAYDRNTSLDYYNSYDEARRKETRAKEEQAAKTSAQERQDFKERTHKAYEFQQREMNYLPAVYDTNHATSHSSQSSSMPPFGTPIVPPGAPKEISGVYRSGMPALVMGRDGKAYTRDAENTLRDELGRAYRIDKKGNPVLVNSYSPNAAYTPTGYTRSDGTYSQGPASRRDSPFTRGSGRSSDFSGHRNPQGAPAGQFSSRRCPLDELDVRSTFAERTGLRLQRFGSQALHNSRYLATSSVRMLASNVVRSDETGTFSTAQKFTRSTVFTAQLVRDIPRMFTHVGSNISYTAGAAHKNGSSLLRNTENQRGAVPFRTKPLQSHISSAREAHEKAVRKEFGYKASRLNLKEIDKQIGIHNSNLTTSRARVIPINKGIKNELRALHPSALLTIERESLLSANKKLKAEIKALQRKGTLSASERRILEKKIAAKTINEKRIAKKSKKIKENGISDAASLKKARELLKKKKLNEEALAKQGGKLKALNKLKKKNLDFDKEMKSLSKAFQSAAAAEHRLKSIPGRLLDKLAQKLSESDDLGGLGRATSSAMSIARNPILRLYAKNIKKLYRQFKGKEKKKVFQLGKKAAEKTKQKLASTNLRKPVGKLHNVTKKTVGTKGTKATKKLFAQNKHVQKWIKASSKKAAQAAQAAKAGASAAKATATAATAKGAGSAAAAGGAAAGSTVLIVVVAILVILALCVIGGIFMGAGVNSSVVLTPQESDEGKIDLTPYVNMINSAQDDLQKKINDIATNKSSVTGKPYDNVFYDFSGESNSRLLLCMAYVRFALDLSDEDAVKAYIDQLYQDSNLIDSAESDLYSCVNGCVEREYHCYDEPDEFATKARKSLYAASDHSDYVLLGEVKDSHLGCEYVQYSCMESGHGTYNRYGCYQHDDGDGMATPGDCNNYVTRKITVVSDTGQREDVFRYYCLGHCSGKHRDYSCPGHKETVCYGEHQDLTITVTSLGMDEIFYADSSLASSGSFVRGDAYKEKFTITAYCSCHECCHPYDPACTGKPSQTASGTTPKANHTIAVDPDVIPLGTHVWINGREYVAEDTGGAINGHHIDMYFNSHQEALNWGKRKLTVYKSNVVSSDSDKKDEYGFTGWTEDNKEIVRTTYKNLTDSEFSEIYSGLYDFKTLSFGSYSGDYDFSNLEFEATDDGSLTRLQKEVLKVIRENKAETQKGYCQAWVADIYLYAGTGTRASKCCANHAGEAWGVSKKWSDIQVGATVYGYSSSQYGHVGIYIGDGKVAHNIGYVKIQSLESWVKTYNGQCWGWNGGYNLTHRSAYDCKASGTFMNGKD